MHKVVIIGGGFAGINLALDLAGDKAIEVTLVDKNNYNFFAPLLYQVSTGMLDVASISTPFRTLFKGKKNLTFRIGELKSIDEAAKQVILDTGKLTYDYLVLATGTTSNYFGNESIEKKSLPMKTIEESIQLRNTLLSVAELATITKDEDEKEKLRNIVITGGGPAGVEVAGMLAELRNKALQKIYPEINKDLLRIYLIEGGESLLGGMRKKSQDYAKKSLNKLGVIVMLETKVDDFKDNNVILNNGDKIPTKTLIWTAGVKAYKFEGLPESFYKQANRIEVDEFNRLKGHNSIFAIGDTCIQKHDNRYKEGFPQLGSVATQQGKQLAKNFKRLFQNKALKPFKFVDKGTMAIIGKSKATADMEIPKKTLTGWVAWAAWLGVHLFLLINYRNKIKTMWQWTTSYLTKTEPDALMIGRSKLTARANNDSNQ
ncbi:NAD(P)/FAD-dependent oxidoreductase [uncultured Winogradskyella sp.]|uniref:NAD(P)/FAD-dependent oxidoreductase n=1 Tax=uncultured Winogradskyella sp. TaxID=395353 RepID=UPI002626BAE3|nr:NAD(P)/FAD-dependent oxidoreductase [uncultured Winogradskyella sp.]